MKNKYRKGEIIELTVDDLSFGAKGVARLNDFVWFVKQGLPGQKVRARITKIKANYGETVIEDMLTPSPYQVTPRCSYFGSCGGCQLQHLDYKIQVEAKTCQIREILERIGGIKRADIRPAMPAENIYGYRNKMEFTFSDKRWILNEEDSGESPDFAFGLHAPQNFNKVIDIKECKLQSDRCNSILRDIHTLVRETGLPPYNQKNHTGFWRFLVVREGLNTGELMFNFITSSQNAKQGVKSLDRMAQDLIENHPDITSIIQTIHDGKAQIAYGQSHRLISGSDKITEKIGNKIYEISHNTFFQTNSRQTYRLFQTIANLAELHGDENVFDLYCGTGAIGIYIADCVKHVLGIEVIKSAIEDGKRNVCLNNLSNVDFFLADMKEVMKNCQSLTEQYYEPDLIIIDPPRGGTHPKTIQGLLQLRAKKIIYVSCNPGILARDLEILCQSVYRLKTVQPVDMFPHTKHIETVSLLILKE